MKFQKIFVTSLIFVLGSVTFAQGPSQVVENWQFYGSKVDEFVVESPLTLKASGELDAKKSRMYFETINGTYLFVFSDPIKSPDNRRNVSRFVNSSGTAKMPDREALEKEGISFTDGTGYRHRIIELRSETRIYIAQTISKRQDDAVAERFLSSLRLASDPPRPSPIEKPDDKTAPNADVGSIEPATKSKPGVPSSTSGSGQGSGSGKGWGNGNGPGMPNGGDLPPRAVAGVTASLRILSKAKPSYTDFARFYQISGTVRLRVTFLKDGSVGSVTTVKDLPFGLTERAIEAARKIRFEPARRDGSLITVTKQVEYTFSLY